MGGGRGRARGPPQGPAAPSTAMSGSTGQLDQARSDHRQRLLVATSRGGPSWYLSSRSTLPTPRSSAYWPRVAVCPASLLVGAMSRAQPTSLTLSCHSNHAAPQAPSQNWERQAFPFSSSPPSINHHSLLITHQSSVITHHSSVTTHQSSVISHQSSVITHHSSLITHHSPLITQHSPPTTQHPTPSTHHSCTHHSTPNTQHTHTHTTHQSALTTHTRDDAVLVGFG